MFIYIDKIMLKIIIIMKQPLLFSQVIVILMKRKAVMNHSGLIYSFINIYSDDMMMSLVCLENT